MTGADKNKRPTLKTIAYMTGLGITTVSKALKDAPDIAEATKQRVKLIADQIGYQPDRAGIGLRTGKTHVISLILNIEEEIPTMTSQFLVGITCALKNTPYNLTLTPYARTDDPMGPVRKIVETRAADGIILSRIEPNDQRVAYLQKSGIPFATHGRTDMGIDHAYCDFDNALFATNAVQLLAQLGCKKVGMIFPPPNIAFARYQQNGYHRGLQETGIENYPITSITLDNSIDQIAEQISTIAREQNRPDGFVCGGINSTIGTIGGIEKEGLEIGKDINIVTKQSKLNPLKWFNRQIYSIEDDFHAAGFSVTSSLISIINGSAVENHQTVMYPKQWGQCVLE